MAFNGYLWLLAQTVERWGKTDWGKLFVVAAGAFGTTVSLFLITLQNHTIAAFAVMLAWWSLLRVWASCRSVSISAAARPVSPRSSASSAE